MWVKRTCSDYAVVRELKHVEGHKFLVGELRCVVEDDKVAFVQTCRSKNLTWQNLPRLLGPTWERPNQLSWVMNL